LTPGISAIKLDNPNKAKPVSPAKTKQIAKAKIISPAPKNERTLSIAESDILSAVNDVDSDLLSGLTLVLSGIMQKLAREKLEIWITSHGGKCTGSVSGKTNILVIGDKLEDGRDVTSGNKYKTAQQKGTTIYNED